MISHFVILEVAVHELLRDGLNVLTPMSSDKGGPSLTERPSTAVANIGVTGLAVMGRNLARNLARHGYVVALHNRSVERTRSLVAEHGDEGSSCRVAR